ncbi:MAG: PASTA domain-containing protein [Solobacterium sp.]|nr:PASTA domain-containing protein [Solobacterium sp.]
MKKIRILMFVCCMFMATLAGACAPSGQPNSSATGDKTVMIDLTGMGKAEVEEWINSKQLNREKVIYTYKYDEVVPEGKVISQTIPAGEQINGRDIGITISDGMDPDAVIQFIDFSNMKPEEIQQWFVNENFTNVTLQYVYEPGQPYGTYAGTNVPDGKAHRSAHIIIKVYADPETAGVGVHMPNMNTWTRVQVEEWCNKNGVNADYLYQKSASVAPNSVISTTPEPNTEVLKGDHIRVILSDGADIQAIDLSGKSKADVDAWGEANGIKISYIQCWHATPSGTLYWNKPNSGTMRVGDTMQVYMSVGPIPMLNFINKLYTANFVGWINSINDQYNQSACLKVAIKTVDSEAQSDLILEQFPTDGYINPGQTIYLTVANHVNPKPTPTPTPVPKIDIPSMTGFSEFDFKHALHAYGVWEGNRTEQYSRVIAKDYIISNDTGSYEEGAYINYVVSLGTLVIDTKSWEGKYYDEFDNYIESVNRMGAGVYVDQTWEETLDINLDNTIKKVEGPREDGMVHVIINAFRYGAPAEESGPLLGEND